MYIERFLRFGPYGPEASSEVGDILPMAGSIYEEREYT